MPYIVHYLLEILNELPSSAKLCVAFSGGLDSHVLLHSLAQLRLQGSSFSLRSAHIDHGLSPDSFKWSLHCQQICSELAVDCTIVKVDVKRILANNSLEEVARNLRYQALADQLADHEYLMTAHTQNDQAETVLLQMLRGCGVKGLAAMPEIKRLGEGYLVRPLLQMGREALYDYAVKENLQWIEDESNNNLKFDRNYIRQQILPVLSNRWPQVKNLLCRTASHAAEASHLLDEIAASDLLALQNAKPDTLSIKGLKSLSFNRQKNLLRFWVHKLGLPLPSMTKLLQIIKTVVNANDAACPLVTWRGAEVRRFRDELYAMRPLLPHDPDLVLTWDMQRLLSLPGGGHLSLAENLIPPQDVSVTVKFRQGGERFHPSTRMGSHPLKKLFQEWGIPSWQRDRLPLIYLADRLVAVPGYAVAKDCQIAQFLSPPNLTFS